MAPATRVPEERGRQRGGRQHGRRRRILLWTFGAMVVLSSAAAAFAFTDPPLIIAAAVVVIMLTIGALRLTTTPEELVSELVRGVLIGAVLTLVVGGLQRYQEKQDDARALLQKRQDDARALLLTLSMQSSLKGINLANTDLRGAYLGHKNLIEANLRDADLRGAILSFADLRGADLRGAKLQRADLHLATLENARLDGAHLAQADLTDARMMHASLDGARLQDARMGGADLPDACLARAQLQRADLSGATLSGAVLNGANVSGTRFESDLRPAETTGTAMHAVRGRPAPPFIWPTPLRAVEDIEVPTDSHVGRVLRVTDGDTLELANPGDGATGPPVRIRLANADAPSMRSHQGRVAAHALRQLLPRGSAVRWTRARRSEDSFGHVVAFVWSASGGLVNQALLEQGLVTFPRAREYGRTTYGPYTVVRRGPYESPRQHARLLRAQAYAQQHGVGMWDSACPPWSRPRASELRD